MLIYFCFFGMRKILVCFCRRWFMEWYSLTMCFSFFLIMQFHTQICNVISVFSSMTCCRIQKPSIIVSMKKVVST